MLQGIPGPSTRMKRLGRSEKYETHITEISYIIIGVCLDDLKSEVMNSHRNHKIYVWDEVDLDIILFF